MNALFGRSFMIGVLMLARFRPNRESDEGFTLIELLVVIIIIGILAAIAIPVFLNQRKKAVQASIKSDLRTVASAMETYYADNQTYPAWTDGSGTAGTVTIGTETITLSKGNRTQISTSTADVGVEGGFCARVWNEDIGDTTSTALYYNSAKGGLQKADSGICGNG